MSYEGKVLYYYYFFVGKLIIIRHQIGECHEPYSVETWSRHERKKDPKHHLCVLCIGHIEVEIYNKKHAKFILWLLWLTTKICCFSSYIP